MRIVNLIVLAMLAAALMQCTAKGDAVVVREYGHVFIVDKTGERWDVSSAEYLGMDAEGFQHGLGRNALIPLDDSALTNAANGPEPNARVIGMASGDDAKAFTVATLREHEALNTTLMGKPVAVGYWPLSDLAAVYSREIEGDALTLRATGWSYDNTFVLMDEETGSLWYPAYNGLRSVQGAYAGKFLVKLDSDDTTWADWLKRHPQSAVLK